MLFARHLPVAAGSLLLAVLASPLHAADAPPAPEVVIETVKVEPWPLQMEYAGRTAGYREVEVRGQVSGILQERTYQEGSRVTKGQVLFKIDPRTYQAALGRAKGALAQEQARYRQTERDLKRIRELQKKGFASESELDNAISNYEQSRANIQAAEAEVQARQIDLDYTTVKAPISGITSKETRSEGSLVVAGDPGSSLLTQITQLDPLFVNFAYPDQEAERLRNELQAGELTIPTGDRLQVELVFGNGSSYPLLGEVDFTDSLITRGTGTVSVRAVVPNPEQVLLPGQFVRVLVKGLVYPQTVSVPEKAVAQNPQGTYVYVLDEEGKAQVRQIETGTTANHRWLVRKGLEGGERVIVEGLSKVRPGAAVSVVQAAGAANSAGAAQ